MTRTQLIKAVLEISGRGNYSIKDVDAWSADRIIEEFRGATKDDLAARWSRSPLTMYVLVGVVYVY